MPSDIPPRIATALDTKWRFHLGDTESMVLRDRNHPCVVVWSTGNEVEEQGSERMLEISKMLADCIKELDDTRPTLVALRPFENDPEIWNAPVEKKAEIVKNVSETVGIVGLNYQDQWCEDFHKAMPDQVFIATEAFHFHRHRDRGSWAFHAMNSWSEVAKTPYVAGQFLWTGIEYRGECSQLWPVRGWKGAPIDCVGYAKPRAWWHASVWRDEPTVRIAVRFREGDTWETPDWSSAAGGPLDTADPRTITGRGLGVFQRSQRRVSVERRNLGHAHHVGMRKPHREAGGNVDVNVEVTQSKAGLPARHGRHGGRDDRLAKSIQANAVDIDRHLEQSQFQMRTA